MNRRIASLLTLVLFVACCAPLQAADEPYDIYVILPLTGTFAFLGRDEQPAMLAAEKYVNATGGIRGRPVHMVIMDDSSSPATSVQLANQIIAKGVPVFLGPSVGAMCGAVYPLVQATGPTVFCLTPVGNPTPGGYAFVNGLGNRDLQANAFRYLHAKGVRKLALLETTDASGLDSEATAHQALEYPDLHDMQIVDVEHYSASDISVAAQLTRIKASGADAISNYVTGTALGTALRGIYESGYTGWVFTSSSNASREQAKQYVGFMPDKLIYGTLGFQMTVGVPKSVQQARATYMDAVKQVGITDPTIGNVTAWDPTMMVIAALRKYGTEATAKDVRDYILSLHDFAGINGVYDFRANDQRGLTPKSTGAMRYDKATNTFVVLSKPGGVPL